MKVKNQWIKNHFVIYQTIDNKFYILDTMLTTPLMLVSAEYLQGIIPDNIMICVNCGGKKCNLCNNIGYVVVG